MTSIKLSSYTSDFMEKRVVLLFSFQQSGIQFFWGFALHHPRSSKKNDGIKSMNLFLVMLKERGDFFSAAPGISQMNCWSKCVLHVSGA